MAFSFFYMMVLFGAVFMVVAAVLYRFPPKTINSGYGYRTPASMESPERWAFAQRFSAIAMFQSGLGLVVVSVLGCWSPFSQKINNIIAWSAFVIAVVVMLYRAEKAIKRKFY